jgi:uncharacterized protein (TIGR02246 family)
VILNNYLTTKKRKKMKVGQLILSMCFVFVFTSAHSQMVNQEAEKQKLLELSREWAKTAQTGDGEKILSYWSEDAILMPPGQASLQGHDALGKMLEGAATIPGFEVNWEPKEAFVSKSGDMGYVIAHKYFKMPDEKGNISTSFFIEVGIWQKQADGQWKNTIDIYNSDPSIIGLK